MVLRTVTQSVHAKVRRASRHLRSSTFRRARTGRAQCPFVPYQGSTGPYEVPAAAPRRKALIFVSGRR